MKQLLTHAGATESPLTPLGSCTDMIDFSSTFFLDFHKCSVNNKPYLWFFWERKSKLIQIWDKNVGHELVIVT